MAWTWRKRKTLIPGVRINFGKKGISTSIGPRGASMTFGPNGTYLNTSIPGTGLYNRQKIGGNSSSDNSGCGSIFLYLLAGVLWILVIFTALCGFAYSIWAGSLMVGVVILTHIIVAIIANRKTNDAVLEETKSPKVQVSNTQTSDANPQHITEEGTKATEDEDTQSDIPLNVPYIPNLDPMFADVARWIVKNQVGATSSIQRQFEIGYNRAGKIADQLEMAGIIGPNKGANGRDILIQKTAQLEQLLIRLQGNDYSNSTETASTENGKNTIAKTRTKNPTKELDTLIGLDSVKKEVEALSNFIKIQQTRTAKGLKTSAVSYHCVFTGNPGTGKTTVARILAKIYKNLGVVSKGHLIETDRAGLVAEYVGQTAVKTNKIIDSALDGVLFIDEAYSLIGGGENDFGKEAIATLLKRMEDNRDRLIVILAGYTKNMKDFIDSNPGLQSRFNRYIEFPDYSADEMLQIFEANMKKYEYHFGKGAKEHLQQYFENEVAHKDANFGNGRLVRNVFEKTLERQANRLAGEVNLTADKLSQIEIEDFPVK